MSWNDENVSRLRDLWDQGLPTAQIGKLIGFTKNAVVGKAHRIGLERRPSPIRRTAVKPDRKKARSPITPKLNFENNFISKIYVSFTKNLGKKSKIIGTKGELHIKDTWLADPAIISIKNDSNKEVKISSNQNLFLLVFKIVTIKKDMDLTQDL